VNHIQLKNENDNRILATSFGISGASIEELSKESQTRTYYNDFLYTLIYGSKLSRENNGTISCPAFFWMQGEFNYSTNNDKGLYPGVPNTTSKELTNGTIEVSYASNSVSDATGCRCRPDTAQNCCLSAEFCLSHY
jgi:hypothetical protein